MRPGSGRLPQPGDTVRRLIFFSIAIVGFVALLQSRRGYPLWHALSDGFFTNAVLFLTLAVLRLAANAGCFDVAGYGIRHVFVSHYPKAGEDEDFLAYRQRKRRTPPPVKPLFVLSVISFALAAVMLRFGM